MKTLIKPLSVIIALAAPAAALAASEQSHSAPSAHSQNAANTHETTSQGSTGHETKAQESKSHEPKVAAKADAAHGQKAAGHWGYEGSEGPDNWGRLSKDYRVCGTGTTQSPIDIGEAAGASIHPIEFSYGVTPLRILHNGHTVQVNYASGNGITIAGKPYELLQLHFHAPSEHSVNGRRADMEAHFVHKNADGQLAVVGVLMQVGDSNLALSEIWQALPKQAGQERTVERVLINARDLLPRDTGYFHYKGSLTTPPCSEGVNWFVLREPVTAGIDQVRQFVDAVGNNARPLQALNNRLLLGPVSTD